jgi:small subunit ribosomal protein S17
MKIFEGKIVSTGMTNTVVVEIGRVTPHPLYKKLIRTTKKYKVDTNGFNDLSVGSVVEITETKPISKGKFFKVTEVVGSGNRAPKASKTKTVEKTEVKSELSIRQAQEAALKVEEKPKAKKPAVKAKAKTAKKESK